jgi:hypothetical protein
VVTQKHLYRGIFTSVKEFEVAITQFIDTHNTTRNRLFGPSWRKKS